MPFPNKETQFKTGLQQVPIARKGGQSTSPKKRLAAYVRWLRKDGVKKESMQKISLLLESRDFCAADIYTYIERLEESSKTNDKLVPLLIQTKLQWFKAVHGDYNTAVVINNQQDKSQLSEVHINIIRPDGTIEETK